MFLSLFAAALAESYDYAEEAKSRMKLSFDLDQVQAELAAPAAAAPPAPRAAPNGTRAAAYVPLPALPLEPNSTLDRVVVMRDRATVTRVRTVELSPGVQRVRFEGLPLGLDATALHADLRAGKAKVVGVELVAGVGDVEETERIKTIRAEAEVLSSELGTLRDHIESLLMQRQYLRSALLPSGNESRPAIALDQVKGSLSWIGEAERDLAAKLRIDEEKGEKLGEKLEPLLVKLRNPLATGMTVRVDIDVATAGKVELALRYGVGGASWTPAYSARLDPEKNSVTLEMNAVVAQATGETWTDVALQLSTADPVLGGAAPALGSWVLDESGVDPYAFAQSGAARSGAGAMVLDAPGKRTIAGDGSQARIPLGGSAAPTALSLSAVPRVAPEVFRTGKVTWTGEAPLLPGPVASFVGGDYVGSAALGAVAPGESLDLGFGVDERIKVDRKLVSRKVEHLVGGRTRYTVKYQTTVHNYAKTAQSLSLLDQAPVSQVDRISVQVLEGTPAKEDPALPAGVRCWTLDLAAGATTTVDFGFVVTAPREMQARMDAMMM